LGSEDGHDADPADAAGKIADLMNGVFASLGETVVTFRELLENAAAPFGGAGYYTVASAGTGIGAGTAAGTGAGAGMAAGVAAGSANGLSCRVTSSLRGHGYSFVTGGSGVRSTGG
jgi:hypothetical protein